MAANGEDGVHTWQKIVDRLVDVLKRLGGVALVGMMVLTCVDVVFRALGKPIFGAVELVSFMATILLACAMPQTHVENGHVGVDLFVRRLHPRTQRRVDTATGLVTSALFAVVAWQMFLYAGTLKRSGEVSMSLEFPNYVFVYLVAVAFGVLTLVVLAGVLRKMGKAEQS